MADRDEMEGMKDFPAPLSKKTIDLRPLRVLMI